jgi:hypothetical protein
VPIKRDEGQNETNTSEGGENIVGRLHLLGRQRKREPQNVTNFRSSYMMTI